MKKSWKFWWISGGIWIILFLIIELFIWLRPVDNSGIIQTPALKIITTLIVIAMFSLPALIQLIWLTGNLITVQLYRQKEVQR